MDTIYLHVMNHAVVLLKILWANDEESCVNTRDFTPRNKNASLLIFIMNGKVRILLMTGKNTKKIIRSDS